MSEKQKLLLEMRSVAHIFSQASKPVTVLRDVSVSLGANEVLGLMGPSGSGKSTLLHIAGLLERPTSGEVIINGRPSTPLADSDRTKLRREKIGFVYQLHHLLPEFSALENVMLPQIIGKVKQEKARLVAIDLLNNLGLGHRLTHKPGELSGGEQQRVAIARALSNSPKLLLADEPTGNLDPKTAGEIIDVLLKFLMKSQVSAIIATHSGQVSERLNRILHLDDGQLIPKLR